MLECLDLGDCPTDGGFTSCTLGLCGFLYINDSTVFVACSLHGAQPEMGPAGQREGRPRSGTWTFQLVGSCGSEVRAPRRWGVQAGSVYLAGPAHRPLRFFLG